MKAWVEDRVGNVPMFIVEAGPDGYRHGVSIDGARFMGDEFRHYPQDLQDKVSKAFAHWFSDRGVAENEFYDATDWRALGEMIGRPGLAEMVEAKRKCEHEYAVHCARRGLPDYRELLNSSVSDGSRA